MTVIITFIYRQATSTRVAMDGRNVPWSSVTMPRKSPTTVVFTNNSCFQCGFSLVDPYAEEDFANVSSLMQFRYLFYIKKEKVKNGCGNIQPLPWPLVQCQGSFVTSLSPILNTKYKLVRFYLLFECLWLFCGHQSYDSNPALVQIDTIETRSSQVDVVKTSF